MARWRRRCRLLPTILAALLLAPGSASAGVGLSLGPAVGGGSLVGGIVELQVARPLFFEADVGLRTGWIVEQGLYPNVTLTGGVNAEFGKRPLRNGVFLNATTTAPLAFYEAWVAAGWALRSWNRDDRRSITLELGPGVYAARELPAGNTVDYVPVFLHARLAFLFPVVARAGNESVRPERPPRPDRDRARGKDAGEAEPPG